ncbi:unnamed protein product [Spirodela intermedia]|uniref:Uncharacterized protein n=1 Tax=Spirodela intermedia TaxID=51605 RepID=A0ABN7ED72_SPIIN|nr:unnamed protein product [Spirodela intermedia]
MKWVVESSPAAVTRRSRKTVTLRLSDGCHPTEKSWMEEVATRLLVDRPLPDNGLFINQSKMIYSMDFDVKGEWRTRAISVEAVRVPARGYSPTELLTCLWARLASGSPPIL